MDLTRYEDHVNSYFDQLPHEAFDYVPCPACGDEAPSIELFVKKTMAIRRCKCGMVWNSHQANSASLEEFYRKSDAMTEWAKVKANPTEFQRQRDKYDTAINVLSTWTQKKSIVDLGCGNGVFLALLKQDIPEMQILGVDSNEDALTFANALGVPTRQMVVSEFLKSDIRADVIALWGVLEHVKEPLGLLEKLKGNLNPNGTLIVCVPNVLSFVVQVLGPRCFTFCPQHLWYFSIQTLKRTFEMAGYRYYDSYTIEPEVKPIVQALSGLDPYWKGYQDWVIPQEIGDAVTEINLIAADLGYKIVMMANKT